MCLDEWQKRTHVEVGDVGITILVTAMQNNNKKSEKIKENYANQPIVKKKMEEDHHNLALAVHLLSRVDHYVEDCILPHFLMIVGQLFFVNHNPTVQFLQVTADLHDHIHVLISI